MVKELRNKATKTKMGEKPNEESKKGRKEYNQDGKAADDAGEEVCELVIDGEDPTISAHRRLQKEALAISKKDKSTETSDK